MSVYDPMGLIANLTIHGRILIQELHKETSDWDAEISERSYNQWKQFLEIIKQAANVKIPRWMLAPKVQKFELHTFVDASEYAYAAATYVRGLGSHGQTVSIRLLAAKSRVAPIKKLSIPRLELLAAVLGTRLTKTLKKELRKKPSKITYWSDSQTVLSWIHSDHRKYKEFVAHRIGEILEETKIEQWRYVPTDENPADEGTKLAKGKPKWLAGPTFIWKEECMWPKSRFMRETTEEIKESVMFHQEVESDFKFIREYRYSNWEKLLKEVCILKKFVDWIKDKRNFDKNISEDDMQIAEYAIVRKAQWEGFTDEMHDITKHGEITKSGRLRCLTPRINDHEVMVVQSRLANTDIVPLSTREPMILPTKHPITRLIMKFYHEENLHHGDQTILAAAKEKYWIIDPRRVHNTVKANCQHCKNEKVSPSEPLMSCLPDCRLDIYNPAFTHTGVDYFGPIEVQVKRSIEKRWGVIFTCLTSRAVYLDLAEKLDTDAFIVCLRNFQVRRGPVKHLYSDNGTNFIGAEKEMQTAVQEIEREMGEGKAAEMRIKWHFNPPAAPHFGGAWERLIRNIKICLYEMAKARQHHMPTENELRSALIQAEGILNRRPITHVSLDKADDEPLTPSHFLGAHPKNPPAPTALTTDSLSRAHYKRIIHYAKYFWDRWRKEYLPTIIKRNKWTKKVEPIKVDDIVVITDKGTLPGNWLKGRVVKVHTSSDGQVRSAEVKTIQGNYVRPATKIAVLDVKSAATTKDETTTAHINLHQEAPKVCTKNRRETKPALQDKGKGQKAPPIKRKRKVVNQPVEIHRINHHREYEDGDIGPVSANRKRKVEGELPSANLTMDQRAGKNFNSWGKRCKVDIDKVKELRDRMNSKQKPRNVTNKTKIHVPWYMTIIMVLFFITAALGQYPTGLIAYDCASPEVNMTSYSLLDVTSCIPSTKNLSISEVPIQVLQRSSKGSTMVYQCKMIIKRSIRHCGMHSHTSDYERGYSYIVKEFTPDECRRTQLTGAIPLTLSAGLLELKRNHTTRGETLVVGSVWASSCSGGVYKTPEYTWINALVYFEYEIALYNYMATIDNENDQIMLRHGLVCPYSHGKCLDSEDGYSTWDVSLNQRCEDTDFEVIYEGKVNKTINIEGNKPNPHAVYTSISDSHLFSIRTKDTAKICRYKGYSTDHPRIFILEEAEFKSPFARRPSSAKNHDIFTYFNSKITLVENYVGQKLDDVYNTVMTEMCKLDKALLETKLTLARINPTEFVNSIMKRTGFSAVVAGEVLHVLECKPVYVQPFASERCYQELPVKFGNVTMFLTPVTRTLQMRGTEIECTPLLPAKFQFGGRWYTFDGKIRETTFPQKLATDIVTKWTYTPLPNLMESGIYDADSLKKMRTMIYDQGDRRIATNVVHKILTGQNPSKQGFHFEALMSEKLIDNMINKYWEKLVSLSSWLGNITSTAIGLYIIGRIIKFLVDTLMHGRILYDIYGFGWQLIASLWDSMTTFLTHRNTLKNIKKSTTRTYDVTTPEDGTNPSENTPLSDEEPQTVARAHPPAHPYVALTMPR